MPTHAKKRRSSHKEIANKRDLEATRSRVLAQARKIFSERGLEGARIDQIAAAAGVSKAMIYYLLPSKEELYKTVLEAIMRDVADATRQQLARDKFGPEDFVLLLRIAFDIFKRNADVARILLRELANGAPYVRQIKQEHPEHFQVFGQTIDRIYDYIRQGKMRPIPAERYVLAVLVLVTSVVAAYPSTNLFLDRENGPPYSVGLDDWQEVVVDLFARSALLEDGAPGRDG